MIWPSFSGRWFRAERARNRRGDMERERERERGNMLYIFVDGVRCKVMLFAEYKMECTESDDADGMGHETKRW